MSVRLRIGLIAALTAAAVAALGGSSGAQTPSPSPSPSASAAPSPSPSASPSPSPSPSPTPAQDPAGLEIRTRTSRVLAQVGAKVRYTVLVTNTGNQAIDDVLVVDLVPAEMTFVSAAVVDEAEAILHTESRGHEDIVWNLGKVKAGQTITLQWTAKADDLGDMSANNTARAQTTNGTVLATSTARTFVGDSSRGATKNPFFKPIVKKVVKKVTVPVSDDSVVSGAPPAVGDGALPVTGVGVTPLVVLGLALVLLGASLVWGTRGRLRAQALAVVALLVMAACTSGDDRTASPEPSVSPSVLGERITDDEADDEGNEADDGGSEDSADEDGDRDGQDGQDGQDDVAETDDDVTTPPVVVAPVPPTTTTRRVIVTRRITLSDLSTTLLGSLPGDNTVEYEWDESAGTIHPATSSRILTPDALASVLIGIGARGDGLEVEVLIKNESERERLRVKGKIVLSVTGDISAELESDPIDVELVPGGETTATFSYLLPSGSYAVTGAFVSE